MVVHEKILNFVFQYNRKIWDIVEIFISAKIVSKH